MKIFVLFISVKLYGLALACCNCKNELDALETKLKDSEESCNAKIADIQIQVDQLKKDNIVLASCCDWYEAGHRESGKYKIDPDGKDGGDSFLVECEFDSALGKARTIIRHDSESKIQVVPKCQNPECYKRPIKYTGSLEQIKAVIDASNDCHQTFKFDCRGSVLSFKGKNYAAWYDRDNQPNYYWTGSGNVKDHTCDCGVSGTCGGSNLKCACDKNDNVWRQDTGVLSSSTQLPVTVLAHGDSDEANEHAYHTLGPLVCEASI